MGEGHEPKGSVRVVVMMTMIVPPVGVVGGR
jgi:hypothetical protein